MNKTFEVSETSKVFGFFSASNFYRGTNLTASNATVRQR